MKIHFWHIFLIHTSTLFVSIKIHLWYALKKLLFLYTQDTVINILDCLAFGRDERSYNADVRTFCLTVSYFSPRAYRYIRDKFNNTLPSPSAMRNWYASLNASPGFTTESFDVLRRKADEWKEKKGSKAAH